ncbi:uncharacterized protein VP01_4412g1 [Puccinia sorghi]|uniref:CCHC-type domain-containing protein n=1 Tax=Puccinia sorghi TaxID=27349 RepID=A0A0L6UQG0_9BASI|nr:uncharacterized protein VP01_4412g1 [Puccinia sorghi]
MKLYQHGLKENIQLAMVMRSIEFDCLRSMQAMALKAGQRIEGILRGGPIPTSNSASAPAPNPNVKDLSAFQKAPSNQLSNTKHACQVQLKLCLCCGQAGHISCGCLNRGRKPQGGNQLSPRQPQRQ